METIAQLRRRMLTSARPPQQRAEALFKFRPGETLAALLQVPFNFRGALAVELPVEVLPKLLHRFVAVHACAPAPKHRVTTCSLVDTGFARIR